MTSGAISDFSWILTAVSTSITVSILQRTVNAILNVAHFELHFVQKAATVVLLVVLEDQIGPRNAESIRE